MIDGEELDLRIGTVSMLSLSPLSLAARSVADGTISNDELPTALPTGVYGCAPLAPLTRDVAGTSEPSEIGISAGSRFRVLNLGTSGMRDLPRSCLSISAKLVLHRSLLFTLGLAACPEVSVLARACTCPATRSSSKEGVRSGFLNPPLPLGLGNSRVPTRRPFREDLMKGVIRYQFT